MFCTKCGVENPDGASVCRSCGSSMTITANATAAAAKTSGLAIASFILGILSFCTFFFFDGACGIYLRYYIGDYDCQKQRPA